MFHRMARMLCLTCGYARLSRLASATVLFNVYLAVANSMRSRRQACSFEDLCRTARINFNRHNTAFQSRATLSAAQQVSIVVKCSLNAYSACIRRGPRLTI